MRSMRRLLTVVSFGWFIATLPSAWADTVVYDDLTGASTPFFGPGCCTIGDEIALGGITPSGTADVSQLKLGIFTQGIDLTVGIEMGIYENNGPGGSPGTSLWQSGPLTGLLVPASATEITVQVPDIAVPDVITVTSYFLSSTPAALGRLAGVPPTIGSSVGAWIYSDGQWELAGGGGYYALQVEAVPEPPSSILIATLLLCMAGSIHRCIRKA